MNLREALEFCQSKLKTQQNPAKEAYSLLQACLGFDHAQEVRLLSPDLELNVEQIETLFILTKRRANHEPMAYIRGWEEFWGLKIKTSPGVLIPRPETEFLVENCLQRILEQRTRFSKRVEPLNVLDLCCGSGAIGAALYHELNTQQESIRDTQKVHIFASELSYSALQIARENLEGTQVPLTQTSFLSGYKSDSFHLIASNPPYVPIHDLKTLEKDVSEYEPHLALFSGTDGMDSYRTLMPELKRCLKSGGLALLECGIYQAPQIKTLWKDLGEHCLESIHDFGGVERIVCLSKTS